MPLCMIGQTGLMAVVTRTVLFLALLATTVLTFVLGVTDPSGTPSYALFRRQELGNQLFEILQAHTPERRG